jgi:hypothetical protein
MTFPRPAPSVPFAAIPLQAAPDQMRATWHGVDSLSRRAFYFQSSRLSPSFLRAGAGSGDCSSGNLPRYSGRRLSFSSKD